MKRTKHSLPLPERKMKKEIRILGIDDAPFNKFNKGERVLVIGTIFRGGSSMDGLMTTYVTADGEDATKNLVKMVNSSRNKDQLSLIMLDGIALGGLNVVDINQLWEKTGIPVVTVVRKIPDMTKMKKAISNVEKAERRVALIEKAGEIYSYEPANKPLGPNEGKIYFQTAGISQRQAEKAFALTVQHGMLPEPIRIAHIIGAGLKKGESRGRA